MKLIVTTLAAAVALTGVVPPAAAQHRVTVSRVHGPVRLIPGHKRKYCQSKVVAHHRVRKCYYR